MKIKGVASFAPEFFLSRVAEGLTLTKYKKTQVIYTQVDSGESVFYLQSGKLKNTIVSSSGKEAVIAIVNSKQFFGEGCLAGQLYRLSTVHAIMDSEVVRIGKPIFVKLLEQERAFAELFMNYMLTRTIRVESDLLDQLFNSSEKRLALACSYRWRILDKKESQNLLSHISVKRRLRK